MRINYRTADGLADYGFSFEQTPQGVWRAYITSQPSYGSRNSSGHSTHRLTDRGRYYVCWTPEPRTLDDLKQVVKLWADRTQRYLKYGIPIERA